MSICEALPAVISLCEIAEQDKRQDRQVFGGLQNRDCIYDLEIQDSVSAFFAAVVKPYRVPAAYPKCKKCESDRGDRRFRTIS